jgi:hypothetical protein
VCSSDLKTALSCAAYACAAVQQAVKLASPPTYALSYTAPPSPSRAPGPSTGPHGRVVSIRAGVWEGAASHRAAWNIDHTNTSMPHARPSHALPQSWGKTHPTATHLGDGHQLR